MKDFLIVETDRQGNDGCFYAGRNSQGISRWTVRTTEGAKTYATKRGANQAMQRIKRIENRKIRVNTLTGSLAGMRVVSRNSKATANALKPSSKNS